MEEWKRGRMEETTGDGTKDPIGDRGEKSFAPGCNGKTSVKAGFPRPMRPPVTWIMGVRPR